MLLLYYYCVVFPCCIFVFIIISIPCLSIYYYLIVKWTNYATLSLVIGGCKHDDFIDSIAWSFELEEEYSSSNYFMQTYGYIYIVLHLPAAVLRGYVLHIWMLRSVKRLVAWHFLMHSDVSDLSSSETFVEDVLCLEVSDSSDSYVETRRPITLPFNLDNVTYIFTMKVEKILEKGPPPE